MRQLQAKCLKQKERRRSLWQDDLLSVANFIHASMDMRISCATGLINDSQTSDQPGVVGEDEL